VREYELTIIIQPEISEEGSAAILERVDGILESENSIRLLCDDMGKRKLAYEIRRFHKGHYYLLSFLDDGQAVPAIERTLRLDESVLRFLTVKVSDHVVDIEARRAAAKEREIELQKRADEKAAREAEEAKAREEAEQQAAAEAAQAAEAAKVAAEAQAAEAAEAAADDSAENSAENSAEDSADDSDKNSDKVEVEDAAAEEAPAAEQTSSDDGEPEASAEAAEGAADDEEEKS
jgi:small subunit ribosomal protein S6